MFKVINALGFQAGWWACIVGAARGAELPALAFCGLLAAVHLRYCERPRAEALLAMQVLFVGIALDTLLQAQGVIRFKGLLPSALALLSPPWLWMLWVLLALTLNASMAFLQRLHWSLVALAGATLGPASYVAGAQLGAAAFEPSALRLGALSLAWMLVLPALVFMARRAFGPAGTAPAVPGPENGSH